MSEPVTMQDFADNLEKHPYSLPKLATLMGVSAQRLKLLIEEGRLYDNGFGGYVIK